MPWYKALDLKIRKLNAKRRNSFRRFQRSLAKALFDSHFKATNKNPSKVTSIAILRLDGKIGDSIIASGLLHGLESLYPNATFTIITNPGIAWLYKPFKSYKVITVKPSFLGCILAAFKLKNHQFDLMIQTSHDMLPRLIYFCSRIKALRKVAMLNQDLKLFSDHALYNIHKDHITQRYNSILKTLGSDYTITSYTLPIPDTSIDLVRKKLSVKHLSPIIVLNHFSANPNKCLTKEKSIEIIRALNDSFPEHSVLSIGGKQELAIIATWANEFKKQNFKWAYFKNDHDFYYNVSLIQLADLVISPDTSIVHVSCALKKPLVALYKEDSPDEKIAEVWGPIGDTSKVIAAPVIPNQKPNINTIQVKEIISAAKSLLT